MPVVAQFLVVAFQAPAKAVVLMGSAVSSATSVEPPPQWRTSACAAEAARRRDRNASFSMLFFMVCVLGCVFCGMGRGVGKRG